MKVNGTSPIPKREKKRPDWVNTSVLLADWLFSILWGLFYSARMELRNLEHIHGICAMFCFVLALFGMLILCENLQGIFPVSCKGSGMWSGWYFSRRILLPLISSIFPSLAKGSLLQRVKCLSFFLRCLFDVILLTSKISTLKCFICSWISCGSMLGCPFQDRGHHCGQHECYCVL